MRRLLLRISAVLGVSAAVAFALVYGVRPAEVAELRKVRATALVELPDGGEVYRTLAVPVPVLRDGGLGHLPDESVISCALSARVAADAAVFDSCLAGGTPTHQVRWLAGHHLGAEDCDQDVCDGGAGVRVESDACACSSGSSCEQLVGGSWVPAPLGLTLAAGGWRGAGCVPKVCVELLGGVSSWPAECPETEVP